MLILGEMSSNICGTESEDDQKMEILEPPSQRPGPIRRLEKTVARIQKSTKSKKSKQSKPSQTQTKTRKSKSKKKKTNKTERYDCKCRICGEWNIEIEGRFAEIAEELHPAAVCADCCCKYLYWTYREKLEPGKIQEGGYVHAAIKNEDTDKIWHGM